MPLASVHATNARLSVNAVTTGSVWSPAVVVFTVTTELAAPLTLKYWARIAVPEPSPASSTNTTTEPAGRAGSASVGASAATSGSRWTPGSATTFVRTKPPLCVSPLTRMSSPSRKATSIASKLPTTAGSDCSPAVPVDAFTTTSLR